MGTDIHAQIEYRHHSEEGWHWIFEDMYNGPGGRRFNYGRLSPFPNDRNYAFFGMLAEVRDDSVETFPKAERYYEHLDDFTSQLSTTLCTAINLADVDIGYHDFCIINAEELSKWWETVKDLTVARTGVVTLSEYEEIKATGERPSSYSGGVGGPNVVTLTPSEADMILDGLVEPASNISYYVQAEWEETLGSLLSWDEGSVMSGSMAEYLLNYDIRKDYEFRYIIGFDS